MGRLANICLLFFLLLTLTVSAQEKYWIYFNSKTGSVQNQDSPDSVRLQRDLQIYQPYLDSLLVKEIIPVVKSKWLNAITALVTPEQVRELKTLEYIKSIKPTRKIASTLSVDEEKLATESFTTALNQVNAQALIDYGFTGEGIDIGIIDGGFLEANESIYLDDIFYDNKFKEYRDFTGEAPDPFGGTEMHNDDHGSRVWRNIGGYDREKERYHGLATASNYYLAKSDRGDREFRGEEDYWIAAIEWMEGLGIKIVNSSLGYSTGFDDPQENYNPEEVNGLSSPLTQAAQIASEEKGMLLVVSAGNDGNKEFQVLSVPADAKDVLTVGSCSTSGKKLSYSSMGPESIPYNKPDVCCYSLGGTSFSAPIITGIAAGMLQHNPNLNNLQIIDLLKKSSSFYPYGNNYIGFGAPDGEKIIKLLKNQDEIVWNAEEIEVTGDLAAFDAEGLKKLVVFHKKNEFIVLKEDEITVEEGEFIIAKPIGALRSTVRINDKIWEIFWQ